MLYACIYYKKDFKFPPELNKYDIPKYKHVMMMAYEIFRIKQDIFTKNTAHKKLRFISGYGHLNNVQRILRIVVKFVFPFCAIHICILLIFN